MQMPGAKGCQRQETFQAFLYVVVLDFVQVPCLKKRLRMNYVSIRTSVKDRVKKSLRQKKFHLTQNRAQWTENIWNIFFFNLLLRMWAGISTLAGPQQEAIYMQPH